MKLLVQGLTDEGPGDILGAIGGETNFDPRRIGEIDIENGRAFVETPADIAEDLTRELEGAKIGGSEVSTTLVDDEDLEELKEISEYAEEMKELVEMEREEEMRRHEESIRNLSGKEREEKGKAILHLRARDEGEGLGGHLVKFMRNHKGEELPDTEISVGDLVMISKNDPLRDDNPTGTVVEKTNYSITASFDEKPQNFVYNSKGLRMDLYVNDITYQRMKDALEKVKNREPREKIAEILGGLEEPEEPGEAEIEDWKNEKLNESQREAVRRAVDAEDFHLIHGPPGTGKTTTAIEVVQQEIDRGNSVIATAASNTAVDNMLEFLLDQGVDAVRVGHPARVTPKLRENTLDNMIQENEKYQRSEELREEAFDLKDEQDDLQHPSGRYRRGMSDEKIKELAEQGRGSRGVPEEKIQEMADWLELQEEIDEKFEKSDELEEEAVEEIIEEVDVVCTTNSTSGSDLLEEREFDVAVIDEATQATEPSCLIPITRASKVVMAGDHRQLPPTVQNQDALDLEYSLFERLAENFPKIKDLLRKQYRMHESIMEFSSQEFYDGELEAAEEVRNHTLLDLGFDTEDKRLDPENPVTFIDTSDIEAPENSPEGSISRENPGEADIVEEIVEDALEAGLHEEDIGVISPYDDQIDLLSRKLGLEDLEVKTVDGFQGREKEMIVISLVRSNTENNIGFLKEKRRLNVSLTRARRKLVVIGDTDTLETDETYRNFIEYVENTEDADLIQA
ncbi:MAG: IGHMBP2 family helicase [Candidatus Nanosalina sp.]